MLRSVKGVVKENQIPSSDSDSSRSCDGYPRSDGETNTIHFELNYFRTGFGTPSIDSGAESSGSVDSITPRHIVITPSATPTQELELASKSYMPSIATKQRRKNGKPRSILFAGSSIYEFKSLLGQGIHASVKEITDKPYVVKVSTKPFEENEIAALSRQEQLIDYVKCPYQGEKEGITEKYYLIIAKIDGIDLATYFSLREEDETKYHQGIDINERHRLYLETCLEVQKTHDLGIIHRDLKPDNVMVDQDGNVKLIDWGYSRIVPEGESFINVVTAEGRIQGTERYIDPSSLDEGLASFKSDGYACGMMLSDFFTEYELDSNEIEIRKLKNYSIIPVWYIQGGMTLENVEERWDIPQGITEYIKMLKALKLDEQYELLAKSIEKAEVYLASRETKKPSFKP